MKTVLTFALLVAACITFNGQTPKNTTVNPIPAGVRAPVIDGDSSDACWSSAVNIPLTVVRALAPELFSARLKLTYDANYLYILAVVNDSSPHWEANYSYLNDCIELIFQMDTISDVNGKYGWGDWQLRKQRHKGIDPNVDLGNDYGFDGDMGDLEHTQTFNVDYMKSLYNKGFDIKEMDHDTIYIQEWKISWNTLAINQRPNTIPTGIGNSLTTNGFDGIHFRFDVQATNNADGTNSRAGQLFYNTANDNAWNDTRALGFITLSQNIYSLPGHLNSYSLTADNISLTLSGSDNNVSYQLFDVNLNSIGSAINGTGSPLKWVHLPEGTYHVNASNDSVSNNITGPVKLALDKKITTINPISEGNSAPIIDGNPSDACWSSAVEIPLDFAFTTAPEPFSASLKYTYDGNFFYILATVNDTSPEWDSGNPWENDCIELFFAMDTIDDIGGKYGWGDWHPRKQRNKGINPLVDIGNNYGFNCEWGDLEHGLTSNSELLKSFYNIGFDIAENDNGKVYTQEWKIPWKVLTMDQRPNTTPTDIGDSLSKNGFDGINFKFNVQASDRMTGVRAGQLFYSPNNDVCWIDTRTMGFLKLSQNIYTIPGALKSFDLTADGATVTLSGSESNVNYKLINSSGSAFGIAVTGNGNALTWENISLGTYYCVATSNNASTIIAGPCNVTSGNPIFNKLPKGIVPKIDGTIESLWDTVAIHTINKNMVNMKPTVNAYWKATWNDTALFILVAVNDDYHCDQWCSGVADYLSDKPEVYLDVNSLLKDGTGPEAPNSGHYQFAPGFSQGLNQIFFSGNNWAGWRYNYSYKLTGTDYVFEYAIPWSTLKDKNGKIYNPTANRMGFDVNILDLDSATEVRKIAVWKNTGGKDGKTSDWYNMDESGIVTFPDIALTPEESYPTNVALNQLPSGIAPSIDGTIETLWDTIAVRNIKRNFVNELPTLDSSYWKAVWNDTAIFVIVAVYDNYHCDEWCSGSPDWASDKPEVYFDANAILKDGQGPINKPNGHYQYTPGFTKDSSHFYFSGINWTGGTYCYAYTISGANYIFEYSIPWSALKDNTGIGYDLNSGNPLGFDVCIVDRDSANDIRRRAVWSNMGGVDGTTENYQNMDASGTMSLTYFKPTLQFTSDVGKVNNGSALNLGYFKKDVQKVIKFSIKNYGQQKLIFSSITSKGQEFTLVQPTKMTLNPLDTLELKIAYKASQNSKDTIEIISNDPVNGTFKVYLSAEAVNATIIPGGIVSGTWTTEGSPYFITGDITIPFDSTLAIEEGVIVEFEGYYRVNVMGRLLANGTKAGNIVFTRNLAYTANINDLSTTMGGWAGINWDNPYSGWRMINSDSSILKYCIFKYSKKIDGDGGAININSFDKVKFYNCSFNNNLARWWGGAIYVNNLSDVTIANCSFSDNQAYNGGAIVCYAGTGQNKPSISGCSFNNNVASNYGGAIYISLVKSHLSITNCSFASNKAYQGGALYSDVGSTPVSILNCKFTYNSSINDGGGIYLNFGGINIQNCLIANNSSGNSGGGICLGNSLNVLIGNNIIANNEATYDGGGMYFKDQTNPVVANNTIVNNHAQNGGGLIFYMFNTAKFYNDIIWGNTNSFDQSSQIYFNTAAGTSVFKNCIIQKGTIVMSNIDNAHFTDTLCSDPYFIQSTAGAGIAYDATAAEWKVKNSIDSLSPAINRGLTNNETIRLHPFDFYNQHRIMNGFIDIGAAEAHISVVTLNGTISTNTIVIADTAIVIGNVTISDDVTLTISPGTKVIFNGYYGIDVQGTIVARSNKTNPIVFTIADTTGFSNLSGVSGGWKFINFGNDEWGANGKMNDNDTSYFQNCIIEYGKFTAQYDLGGAIVVGYFSRLIIKECVFRNNIGVTGGALFITNQSSPLIINNLFYNNLATSVGGAVCCYPGSEPLIMNNTFINNKAQGNCGQGGAIFSRGASPILIGNIISNNSALGTFGCAYGGGLSFNYFSKAVLINNTIVNNYSDNYGGGMQVWDLPFNLYNNLFWGNTSGTGIGNEISTDANGANFYNCNIKDFNIPGNFNGVFNDSAGIMSIDPGFLNTFNPANIKSIDTSITKMLDPDYYASNISTFSGNIDKGTLTFTETGIELPAEDIFGNSRINNGKIDIGASENQGLKLNCLKQPLGGNLCVGDPMTFVVKSNDTANYQWQKDGQNLTGATSPVYTIQSVTENDEGNYSCIISNAFGKTFTNQAFLKVKTYPEITDQSTSAIITGGTQASIMIQANGTRPLQYIWKKDGNTLSNDTLLRFAIDSFTPGNEGTYLCVVKNQCGSKESKPVTLSIAPEICMVTVEYYDENDTDGHNKIIWEKNSKVIYKQFNIYRESNTAGYYTYLASVPYSNESYYDDTSVNPKEQAFLYKITATGLDNVETKISLSKYHKTIHLITTTEYGVGGVQLDWDEYIGFPYSTYYINRSYNGGDYEEIHSMASTTTAWTDYSVDPALDQNDPIYKYFIAVKKQGGCDTRKNMKKKAGGGLFSQAESNMEDNRLQNAPQLEFEITKQPAGGYKLIGESMTFSVEATNATGYQWMKNGEIISGATSSSYYIAKLSKSHMGDYSCIVYMDNEHLQSINAFLFVEDPTSINKNIDDMQLKVSPNPSDSRIRISYKLKASGMVYLRVFNIYGQKVMSSITERQNPGEHEYYFGDNVASGTYLMVIEIDGNLRTERLVIRR
jgi:parallel beta-helix repeat protein